MNFKAFKKILPLLTNSAKKYPIMLRSKHGVGKSALVYQLGEKLGLEVIERRVSQMTDGDLLGLPKLTKTVTKFLPPEWLYTACTRPVILFIDELDRGAQEVRQGFFELCDSRKIAGYHLHEGTLVFAAINGGAHAAQYQIGELDPAERDRWTIFDLEPNLEDWIDWAKETDKNGNLNIHPEVINFIRKNPKNLEHNADFDPTEIYPSRRSWHRLSEVLTEKNLIKPSKQNPELVLLSQAFVGFAAAVAFDDHLGTLKKQVTPENILTEGKFDLLKNFTINDHLKVVEQANDRDLWNTKLTNKQVENFTKWFKVLPSEIGMKMFEDISSASTKSENPKDSIAIKNIIAIHKTPGFKKCLLETIHGEIEKKELEEKEKKAADDNKKSKKK